MAYIRMATVDEMNVQIKKSEFSYSVPRLSLLRSGAEELAFIGRSNAGKSSLINAFCRNKDLARTSKTPGRTRHACVYNLSYSRDDLDLRLDLVDLPGFGFAAMSKKEAKECENLIFSYLRKRQQLRVIVLILDIRRMPDERENLIMRIAQERNISLIVVLSKADKLSLSKRKPALHAIQKYFSGTHAVCLLHSIFDDAQTHAIRQEIFRWFAIEHSGIDSAS